MPEQEPVDAATYAAHLERLDRIGREALAADPAAAITLVREANTLVGELLPMHRQLMEELAEHRSTLQSACEELAEQQGAVTGEQQEQGAPALERLDGIGEDEDAPF